MKRSRLTGALAALVGFVAVETADAAQFRLDVTGVIDEIVVFPELFELSNPTIFAGDAIVASFLFDDAAAETAFENFPRQTARFPIISGIVTIGALDPIDILFSPRGLGIRSAEDVRSSGPFDTVAIAVSPPGQTADFFELNLDTLSDVFEMSTPDQLSALAGTGFGAFEDQTLTLAVDGAEGAGIPTIFGNCFSRGTFGCPVSGEVTSVSVSAVGEVPLPAGGALLLTGLGAFALFRRRQA